MAVHIHRKDPVSLEEIVRQYIRSMKIAAGLNTQRVYAAWDACSGAGPFTLKRFYRSGKLYITLSSSVLRSQLYFQREDLVQMINAYLSQDELFTEDNRSVSYVQELILK